MSDNHVPGTTKYKPEYADQLREMREKGYSLEMVADEFGVRRKTIFNWRREHEEFERAYEETPVDETLIRSGRPTNYRPEMCRQVIEMGREGKTPVEWADSFGVARQTLNKWRKRYPRFRQSYARAREACQAWWIVQGREGMGEGSKFNDRQWKMMVTNLFKDDWQDTRSLNVSGSVVHLDSKTLRQLPAPLIQRIADGEDAETVLASVAVEVLGELTAGEIPEADYEVISEDDA